MIWDRLYKLANDFLYVYREADIGWNYALYSQDGPSSAYSLADGGYIQGETTANIDDIASLYDAETVRAAKYTNPCTAQEMAFRAAVEMAKQGRTFMSNLESDVNDSGAQNVGAAPGGNDGNNAPSTAESMKAAGKAMAEKLRGKKTEEV